MKRICESLINPEVNSSKNSTKTENKKNKTNMKTKKDKIKIDCLGCKNKKNRYYSKYENLHNEENSQDYLFHLNEEKNNHLNHSNFSNKNTDKILKNISFYDVNNYHTNNSSDLKEVLNFPNINNSFLNFDINEIEIKVNPQKDLSINNNYIYDKDGKKNLILFEKVENNLFCINKNENKNSNDLNKKVQVKTLYSNEDISMKYNYILKKII